MPDLQRNAGNVDGDAVTGNKRSRSERCLLDSVRLVHGRDTCDDAGRPLSTYLCDYHQGYEDGLDALTSLPVEQRAEAMGMERVEGWDDIDRALAHHHAAKPGVWPLWKALWGA